MSLCSGVRLQVSVVCVCFGNKVWLLLFFFIKCMHHKCGCQSSAVFPPILWGQVRHAEMHWLSAWSKSCFVLWSSEKIRLALYIWLCISSLWSWFCLWHNSIIILCQALSPELSASSSSSSLLYSFDWFEPNHSRAWLMCSQVQSTGGIEAAVPHQGSGLLYCHFIVCDYMADIKVGKPVRWLLLVLSKFKKKKQA